MRCFIASIAMLLLTATAALADTPQFSVEVLPAAKHYGTTPGGYDFNALPNGVAVLIPLDKSDNLDLIGLHFTNSFYRSTNVVGLSYTPLQVGPLRIGGVVGVSNKNAYPYSPIKPFILAGEVNVVLGPRSQLNIDILPCGGPWCSVALAFGLRQSLGRR